jgi:hypothetical protein
MQLSDSDKNRTLKIGQQNKKRTMLESSDKAVQYGTCKIAAKKKKDHLVRRS